MLADELDSVVGVDPHRDTHALAIVDVRTGGVVFEASVAASSGGYNAPFTNRTKAAIPSSISILTWASTSRASSAWRCVSGEGASNQDRSNIVRKEKPPVPDRPTNDLSGVAAKSAKDLMHRPLALLPRLDNQLRVVEASLVPDPLDGFLVRCVAVQAPSMVLMHILRKGGDEVRYLWDR
jgi:hypothetical protein